MIYTSLILSSIEDSYLANMTNPNKPPTLLYRATRDGFGNSNFHSKVDGQRNTVSIIMTNSSYVLGGFTAAAWHSSGGYIADSSAFIFSLRRNGTSNSEKFMVKDSNNAIYGGSSYHIFIGVYDLRIVDKSNITTGSYANIGYSYNPPNGYIYQQTNTRNYLAGSYKEWLTTEIEVFQI